MKIKVNSKAKCNFFIRMHERFFFYKGWVFIIISCFTLALLSSCVSPIDNSSNINGQSFSSMGKFENLVFGIDSVSLPVEYKVSQQLQDALNDPMNDTSVFRVKIKCLQPIKADYLYQEKSYQVITENADQLSQTFSNNYGVAVNLDGSLQFISYPKNMTETYSNPDAYLSVLEKDVNFIADKQKMLEANQLKREAERQFYTEQLSAEGVTAESVVASSDEDAQNAERLFCADMSKEQIEKLAKKEGYRLHLTLPSRPQNYNPSISDSLVAKLEYSEQEVYYVRVNSVLCHTVAYGNNLWNADRIRILKDEEITQKFGEDFLQNIRSRHKIITEYIPTKGTYIHWVDKTESVEIPITEDWYVPDKIDQTEEATDRYFGGFFEARLTKQQILALAEDSDVRSIYPAQSEYK